MENRFIPAGAENTGTAPVASFIYRGEISSMTDQAEGTFRQNLTRALTVLSR